MWTLKLSYFKTLYFSKNICSGKAKVCFELKWQAWRDFTGCSPALAEPLGHPLPDSPTLESSEQVYVSSLALLKMLKHGPEMVDGWYHSHPGFGHWLSGYDINTQQTFEALNQMAVAVVVDPIQSIKRKVVIDAFRLINPQTMMLGREPGQTTSNVGHLNRPSIQVCFDSWVEQAFYSIAINYQKNELEETMLLNLHKKKWTDGSTLQRFENHSETKRADSAGLGGDHYWGRNDSGKVEGIVVVFAWMSSHEKHLKNYVDIYSSLGWNSIVCQSQFLKLKFFPEKAASLAREVVNELIQELKVRPCPVIFASFSGGPKRLVCTRLFRIEGKCEEQINMGRAGVPMEVMGLMLGEFVDEYTLRVVDVFAMPQSGIGVIVEAIDHVFQTNMLDMPKQTGM
ncbi:hypothetical protein OROGR_029156 [Orobanche gracilis]